MRASNLKMKSKIILLNLLFVFCFAIDRLTKLYFVNTGERIILWQNNLLFELHKNSGAIFGWWQMNIIFYILIVLILFLLFRLLLKEYQQKNLYYLSIISFILIGAISNLIDRWRWGAVIDWINVPWWSVFNLADVYIIGGVIGWVFYLFYADKKIQQK